MAYSIIISPRAQREFYKAIEYYTELSSLDPAKFVIAVQEAYAKLAINPFYQVRYKGIRAIPIKGFPYLLLFIVDEINEEVQIRACFHTSKNPGKYPN